MSARTVVLLESPVLTPRSAYATAANAAATAANAADAAAKKRDKSLAAFAEGVVQILIEMKAPGCQWLDLAEAA